MAELEAAKLTSQQKGQTGTIQHPDGDLVVVAPQGGGGEGFPGRWKLHWCGMTILVSAMDQEHDTRPNLRVEIPSLPLMRSHHLTIWAEVKRFLAGLGFELSRGVPGRTDFCVDLADLAPVELERLWRAGHAIQRGRKENVRTNNGPDNVESFEVGLIKSDVFLRVYHKYQELLQSGKEEAAEKYDILVERRWGKETKTATRVEFKVTRDLLRERFDVKDVDDLFAKAGAICEWLTGDWFRLALEQVDRKNGNQARSVVHPVWGRVQGAFKAWTGDAIPIAPREAAVPKGKQLMDQILGCAMSYAVAKYSDACHSTERFLEIVQEAVRLRIVRTPDLLDRLWARSVDFQSRGRGAGLVYCGDIPF